MEFVAAVCGILMCFLTRNQEHFSDPNDTTLQLNKFLLFITKGYRFRLLYDFKNVSLTKFIQGVSGGIVTILVGGSMDYSE